MGVTGLWKLIDSCGKPVPVESLEGKILSVDISIWLHQVIKGFQDNKGAALNNAHLLGLFHRLCKLLYYRVKPVFVFDGCVPQLKKETIARRQQQRSKLNTEAERIQALLLQSLAKEQMVQQALGPETVERLLTSPLKRIAQSKAAKKNDAVDDMFKLPDLPCNSEDSQDNFSNSLDTSSTEIDNSTSEEECPRRNYNTNLQNIDVRSQRFLNLPADVRHEILVDIKETRKQSSWGRLHELPSRSDDFSTFQMRRLLKRRDIQVSLEEAEKQMGGRSLTYSELKTLFTEEGILEPSIMNKVSQQVCSDENTRFLLVKDLKKNLSQSENVKEEETSPETKPLSSDELLPSTSKTANFERENESNSDYETDLQMAIALSLADATIVYDEKDYEYDSSEALKLNKSQSRQLRNAAKGPARSYMIEYAGMNDDEVVGIMDKTQDKKAFDDVSFVVEETVNGNDGKTRKEQENENNESQEIKLYVSDNDFDTDSDLEEVQEVAKETMGLNIIVNVNESLQTDNDLFKDVFEHTNVETREHNAFQEKFTQLEEINCTSTNGKSDEIVKEGSQFVNAKTIQEDQDCEILVHCNKNVTLKVLEPENVMSSILRDLQEQAQDIKNIKLESVKLSDSGGVIEIEDESVLHKPKNLQAEIIEIYDSDDNKRSVTPTSKTPTKNCSITDYFQVNYAVKRTPDKGQNVESCTQQKVKSPFFVHKTPKGDRKRKTSSPSSNSSKVSKNLFNEDADKKERESLCEQEIVSEAAKVLESEKTAEELQTLARNIAQERKDLENERNRQERMGMSITQRMNSECQQLLRLFGIPYIVAPMEAEAQCAFLDIVDLTQGTITDDSDIWLFGGRNVYKNFFAQNKHVTEFRAAHIEQNFNCDRYKLIQLACLVGSDYTTGIHGIGTVTALEILAQFSSAKEICNEINSSNSNITQSLLVTLQKFRDWWRSFKHHAKPPGSSARFALQKKLKNIELQEGFPNIKVIEAYVTPTIDTNRETFTWGDPDVESIREFARQSFGWTTDKVNNILQPVLKKLNEKKTQTSIRNYLTINNPLSVKPIKVSKRVQKAIAKLNGAAVDPDDKPDEQNKVKRNRNNKTCKEKKSAANDKCSDVSEGKMMKQLKDTASGPVRRSQKRKEIIPQREKDLQQMEANKKLAVEIMKNAKNVPTKQRKP
uniref:XPG N-terminal domain-containing protein n=1 Tax=Glossina brevipalpis TaxID=37001 RepID=A0A1A9WFY6_9MUSC